MLLITNKGLEQTIIKINLIKNGKEKKYQKKKRRMEWAIAHTLFD